MAASVNQEFLRTDAYGGGQVVKISPGSSNIASKELSLSELLNDSVMTWKRIVNQNVESLGDEVRNLIIPRFEQMSEYHDWCVEDFPVTEESAKTCMELLKQLRLVVAPQIGCDYGGNVIVYWGNLDKYASFTCFEDNEITWFATYNKGTKRVRLGGHGQPNSIIEELNIHDSLRNVFVVS